MLRERQRQGRIDSWEKPIFKGQAQESPAKENVLPSLKLSIVSKFLSTKILITKNKESFQRQILADVTFHE